MDLNGNQVIAVDFDGTLCKQARPECSVLTHTQTRSTRQNLRKGDLTMWKRIKRAIRIAKRNSKARRQRKRTSEILLAIFTLTNCGTLQELEYHAGYYAGTADQAAAVGEITREQRGQILRVIHYISAGERERLENE